MDNGAMENFFGRLKVEMFYGKKLEGVTRSFINLLIISIITITNVFRTN